MWQVSVDDDVPFVVDVFRAAAAAAVVAAIAPGADAAAVTVVGDDVEWW